KWVVDCQHVGKGLPALKYLSRYLYRGVLPDKNIVSNIDGQISFEYQNSQTNTTEIRTLPTVEFLWLVLQHVLPKGLRRVRDFGLLRGGSARLRQRIRLMLAVAGAVLSPLENITKTQAVRPCPYCRQPMVFMGYLQQKNRNKHARLTSFIRQKTTTPNATV
ncbi:transposase, partial [Shewanella sp. UCD-KL21]|uniref:transposase n=1 Tax=Shewanella sp. UCD-KL21 TaxID=1917164 RepID=UPI00158D24EF